MRTTITADVPGGGDQVTTYTYGTTKGVSAGDSEIATGHLLQKVAYPDSTGSSDTVTYAYDTQGRQDWMKDQSGNIIETTFDNAGRETSRAVTTLASGFNGDVRRIETSYTNRGQVENVTQYDAASSGSVLDQVEYAYTRHGGVESFRQDMNGVVDGVSSVDDYSVEYAWELSTGGRESWRRTGVILPSGNVLTYAYGSGIDDEVSRLSIIKDGALRLAEYDYLGYTRVVGQTYAIPDLMQEYYGSTSGDYSGFDRFGRVVRSRWQRDTGSGDIDVYDVELAYDRNSNITLAEDAIIPGRDVEYTMDGLNRLVQAEEGTWSGSAITSQSRDEQWTLDHLGNWDSHQLDLNGDTDYVDADELDETRTHNAVNELLTRDLDSDMSTDETLAYNAVGELTDDGAEWKYVYDAFGRLCEVKDQSDDLVAEYRYNGLGFQIAEHTDTDVDGDVDGSDLWYYSAFDERWRKLATFRSSDSDPKEEFVPHNAGLDGMGGSSYINDTVLRDKDDNTAWTSASDGTLEQRIFYLNNWRGDVVGLVTSTGYQGEFVRYSAYGTPFNYPGGDADSDGDTDAADGTVISGWVSGMTYDLRGDLDLDGDVDSTDGSAFSAAYTGAIGGQGVASLQGSRIGFAGGIRTLPRAYSFRTRSLLEGQGKWATRDHTGHLDGYNLYQTLSSSPLNLVDPMGTFGKSSSGGATLLNDALRWAIENFHLPFDWPDPLDPNEPWQSVCKEWGVSYKVQLFPNLKNSSKDWSLQSLGMSFRTHDGTTGGLTPDDGEDFANGPMYTPCQSEGDPSPEIIIGLKIPYKDSPVPPEDTETVDKWHKSPDGSPSSWGGMSGGWVFHPDPDGGAGNSQPSFKLPAGQAAGEEQHGTLLWSKSADESLFVEAWIDVKEVECCMKYVYRKWQ